MSPFGPVPELIPRNEVQFSVLVTAAAVIVERGDHATLLDQGGVYAALWSRQREADAFYDEFVISAFIAGELSAGGTLYFPVVQECEKGTNKWVEVPSADKPADRLGNPAPGLKLLQKAKGHGE